MRPSDNTCTLLILPSNMYRKRKQIG